MDTWHEIKDDTMELRTHVLTSWTVADLKAFCEAMDIDYDTNVRVSAKQGIIRVTDRVVEALDHEYRIDQEEYEDGDDCYVREPKVVYNARKQPMFLLYAGSSDGKVTKEQVQDWIQDNITYLQRLASEEDNVQAQEDGSFACHPSLYRLLTNLHSVSPNKEDVDSTVSKLDQRLEEARVALDQRVSDYEVQHTAPVTVNTTQTKIVFETVYEKVSEEDKRKIIVIKKHWYASKDLGVPVADQVALCKAIAKELDCHIKEVSTLFKLQNICYTTSKAGNRIANIIEFHPFVYPDGSYINAVVQPICYEIQTKEKGEILDTCDTLIWTNEELSKLSTFLHLNGILLDTLLTVA